MFDFMPAQSPARNSESSPSGHASPHGSPSAHRLYIQRNGALEFVQLESKGLAPRFVSVDFRVGEAVNNIKMVYGMIPKKLFRKNKPLT